MDNVALVPTDGKPLHIDWMTGEEVFYPEETAFVPNLGGPTPEEEWEGAEIMATMTLDFYSPKPVTFVEFLRNQARLCRIRDGHPWWEWLGGQIDELAKTADFVRAQQPDQLDERVEVMSRPVGAAYSIDMIRICANLCQGPDRCLAPELHKAADTLDRIIRARS